MANIKVLKQSFAGGEITPELYGRLDLPKFQTGVATCKNFIVLAHGPVSNRAGFEYINFAKTSASKVRLIPFTYSTTQTYALEFGVNYIRFHTNGGTLLETAKTITGITQPAGVITSNAHGFANGDGVYLASIVGMTQLNGRYAVVSDSAANTFRLKDQQGNYITTGSYDAYVSGGTVARIYTLTTTYAEADIFDIHYVQSADVLTLVHPGYPPKELKRISASSWTFTSITFGPTIAAPVSTSAVATVGAGTVTYTYVVTAISSDGRDESIACATPRSCTNNLVTLGNKNTFTWASVSGAIRYNVYRDENGIYGYIGQTASLSFVDDNYNPDTTVSPPETKNPFTGANKYPSAVSYFEQRRIFGGTNDNPQTFWLTRSATESNLNFSIPTQASDGIEATVASREVQRIRHFLPLSDLLFLTPSGEWKVGSGNDTTLTPTTLKVAPQSYVGSSNVQPVVTGNSVLYVQNKGSHIREMAFEWQASVYKSTDASIMAPHLFDNNTISDMAFSRAPYQITWVIRGDGVMLGLTYVPEHQVTSWHQHETDGLFESVCSVSEGNEDITYVVVKRTINGSAIRYIERLHSRYFATKADCFFVDSGLSYSGTATSTISGLWHLEGKSVSILADGAVHPNKTVASGSITLDTPASKVHVGLGYTCEVKTLPVAISSKATPDFGFSHYKNTNKVWLQVNESSGIFAGPATDMMTEYKQRTNEPYGTSPALVSTEIEILLSPQWGKLGQVLIRQTDPLPLTLVSMTAEVSVGG